MSKSKFFKQSLKNFQEMGSIVRSGHQMCKKMTQYIPKNKDLILLEFGAGDGAITDYIIKKLTKKSRLIIFEINEEMASILHEKFKSESDRITIINDGAQNAEMYLQQLKIEQVDMIISAIPFIVLPEKVLTDTLKTSKKILKKHGLFIQMHYTLQLKNVYDEFFSNVELSFVPLNIPPGYVLKCVNG